MYLFIYWSKKERKNIAKSFLYPSLDYSFHLAQCIFRIDTFGAICSVPARSYVGQQEPSTSWEKSLSAISAPSLPGLLTAVSPVTQSMSDTRGIDWVDWYRSNPTSGMFVWWIHSEFSGWTFKEQHDGGGGGGWKATQTPPLSLFALILRWHSSNQFNTQIELLVQGKTADWGGGVVPGKWRVDVHTSFFSSSSSSSLMV